MWRLCGLGCSVSDFLRLSFYYCLYSSRVLEERTSRQMVLAQLVGAGAIRRLVVPAVARARRMMASRAGIYSIPCRSTRFERRLPCSPFKTKRLPRDPLRLRSIEKSLPLLSSLRRSHVAGSTVNPEVPSSLSSPPSGCISSMDCFCITR